MQPRLTVILPCRNEARYMAACLDSILAGAYPADRLEILVVDGDSTDATRDVVRAYAAQHPHVRLLDNPGRIVPTALNIGIRAATGDVIARMDAHVIYPPEYLPRLVREGGAASAAHHPPGHGATASHRHRARHPFGVGNSLPHRGDMPSVWLLSTRAVHGRCEELVRSRTTVQPHRAVENRAPDGLLLRAWLARAWMVYSTARSSLWSGARSAGS
jgi:glycosyltransferase involved in cell wall biosynthesis